MTRDQFDEAFSFFPLSEIIQTLPSKTKTKKLLETFIPIEENIASESIKMIKPYFEIEKL